MLIGLWKIYLNFIYYDQLNSLVFTRNLYDQIKITTGSKNQFKSIYLSLIFLRITHAEITIINTAAKKEIHSLKIIKPNPKRIL